MVGLQFLCIPTFMILPAILGYLLDRPHLLHQHSGASVTLYAIALMNLTTVLLSVAFIASLVFVVSLRFFWPVLERAMYPIAGLRLIRNRKFMGGIAVLCLSYAFNLTSGLLKAIIESAAK